MKYKLQIHLVLFTLLFFYNLKFIATPYYVNDNSNVGNVFTYSVGLAGNNGLTKSTPNLTLSYILTTYSLTFASGDTIYIDAGSYTEIFLSSPQNGVVIRGAGAGASSFTKFSKSGSDRYFMLIDDNNTVLSHMILDGYDNSLAASGKGMTIDVASGITGVVFNNVVVSSAASSVGGVSWPIKINASTVVTFNGGGSVCNSTDGTTPGGGILITGTSSTVSINNYQFVNNYRPSAGSNLCITGGNATNLVNIKNSRFEKGTTSGGMKGVGIYISSGIVNIYDCLFKSNTQGDGGGNFVGGVVSVEGTTTVTISRSTFTNNSGTGSGGVYGVGIGVNSTTAVVEIDSCWFGSNAAGGTHGNDLEVKAGTVNVKKCTFTSVSKNVNLTGGSCTLINSGAPTGSTSVTMSNSSAANYTPAINVWSYSGNCVTTIVLPIELTRFEGECNDNQVMLIWQTATETNNKLFNIERSMDGISFQTIGSINGVGTSVNYNNYTFIDDDKLDNLNSVSYYRLSQIDYDGKANHSQIISIDHLCGSHIKAEINLFPNPSISNITIELKLHKASVVTVEMYNQIGQLVKNLNTNIYDLGLQSVNLDLNNVDSGVYYLKVDINNQVTTHKIIKI